MCLCLIGRSGADSQNNDILKAANLEELLPIPGSTMIFSGLYIVFTLFYSSYHTDKGWITLADSSILLQYKETEKLFSLSDIKRINIILRPKK